MADWQPIETAPKDGTDILLFFPLEGLSRSHPKRVIAYWSTHGERWTFQNRACAGYSPAYQPTHWQPLPEPPLTTKPSKVEA